MTLKVEATYENGVFVPVQPPALADHERVRLTIETDIEAPTVGTVIRRQRIVLDPQLTREIAISPEFLPEED
jgi:predicted DNA-binding antitoxin AbrB/MazE fold protein